MGRWMTGVALGAAVLCGSAAVSTAGDGSTPYKDEVVGTIVGVTPDIEPGVDRLDFETTGKATQLGKFTSQGFLDVSDDLTFTGENTLTAANGDQIFLTIEGSLSPTDEEGVFDISLDTAFTGGTGRFVGVTGGFHGEGQLEGNSFTGVGEGRMSKPKKK